MYASIFFLVTFAWYVIFGKGIDNWHDWIFGAAFGVSVCQLILPRMLKEELRGKRVSKR